MVTIKTLLVLGSLLLLICFTGCDKLNNEQNDELGSINLTEPTVNVDANTSALFADTNPINIVLTERVYIEETCTLESINRELCLSDKNKETLMELLYPYNSMLSKNIIKADFMSYFSIYLNNDIELMIDANCSNYGGDKSYMFVRQKNNGLLSVYGTYIDATVVDYLSEKCEE